MDLQIVELINSVGFPIVVCIALFWMINNTLAKVNSTIENVTLALNNQTRVIETLLNKLGE